MAEFLERKAQVVKPGEPIDFGIDPSNNVLKLKKWRIVCVYKTPECLKSRVYEKIEAFTYHEAYNKWRQMTWQKLYDPINIKIESINITEMEE